MLVEYIVFFSLLFIVIGLAIIELTRKKRKPFIQEFDVESAKIESPIERKLYNALKHNGYIVRTQYVVPPKKYRIDIAFPAYKLAIECDGKAYHSTRTQKLRDQRKNRYLKSKGWRVLRFSGKRIHNDIGGVIMKIQKELEHLGSNGI